MMRSGWPHSCAGGSSGGHGMGVGVPEASAGRICVSHISKVWDRGG